MLRVVPPILLVGFLAATACSLSVDADRRQCRETSDCRARGAEFEESVCINSVCQPDPKWSCLDEPLADPAANTGPYEVKLPLIILNAPDPTKNQLAGANVKVCPRIDPSCDPPLMETTSDESGLVTLQLNAQFAGFLEITKEGFATTLYAFNPPVDRDQTLPNLSVTPAPLRQAIVNSLQASEDRADILLQAFDCTGRAAEGVVLELGANAQEDQPEAIKYYLEGGFPARDRSATDITGFGGFMNLVSGQVVVNAKVGGSNRQFNSVNVFVKGGASTWTRMLPLRRK